MVAVVFVASMLLSEKNILSRFTAFSILLYDEKKCLRMLKVLAFYCKDNVEGKGKRKRPLEAEKQIMSLLWWHCV